MPMPMPMPYFNFSWTHGRGMKVRRRLRYLSEELDKINEGLDRASSGCSGVRGSSSQGTPKIKEIPEKLEKLEKLAYTTRERLLGHNRTGLVSSDTRQTPGTGTDAPKNPNDAVTSQGPDTDAQGSRLTLQEVKEKLDRLEMLVAEVSFLSGTVFQDLLRRIEGASEEKLVKIEKEWKERLEEEWKEREKGWQERLDKELHERIDKELHERLEKELQEKLDKEWQERLEKEWQERLEKLEILWKERVERLKLGDGLDSGSSLDHQHPDNLAWRLPKDDKLMVRLFEGVNSHLKNHVINFYIPLDNKTPPPSPSKGISQDFMDMVDFEHLLSDQTPRTFILRTIIASEVLRGASEVAKERAPGVPNDDYRKKIPDLAKAVHEKMGKFVSDDSLEGPRFRSMVQAVTAAVDFALIMENQPTEFKFNWVPPTLKGPSSDEWKEVVYITPENITPGKLKTQATVFPGLLKRSGEREVPLARARVFIY